MHAPLGDDYFNVMRSMLERERDFTPMTTSIVDRHVLARGSQEKVVENIICKDKQEQPDLIVLTPTCTSSILQEDLQNFVNRALLNSKADILLADVNHYRINELQAADRTLQQIIHFYLKKCSLNSIKKTIKPSVNIIGIFTLGFHHQHDCRELKRLFYDLDITINLILPEGLQVQQIHTIPNAWLNIVPYREVGLMTATYLENKFQMPFIDISPIGLIETSNFIHKICSYLPYNPQVQNYINNHTQFRVQSAWFARSIDCQNLTGKKAIVFGDTTHAIALTKILVREMGIQVLCAGTYCIHDANWFREQLEGFCQEILITEDHTKVANMIARLEPSAIFGTQMERHIGKRLNIPCGVISAPIHIQNFPLGYRPFVGYEGTNQIADLIYNSFTLGMEDHLLEIFGGHDIKEVITKSLAPQNVITWSETSLLELKKIPGFVRNRIKRNTEQYAQQNNIRLITLEVMYAAKEALATYIFII